MFIALEPTNLLVSCRSADKSNQCERDLCLHLPVTDATSFALPPEDGIMPCMHRTQNNVQKTFGRL